MFGHLLVRRYVFNKFQLVVDHKKVPVIQNLCFPVAPLCHELELLANTAGFPTSQKCFMIYGKTSLINSFLCQEFDIKLEGQVDGKS